MDSRKRILVISSKRPFPVQDGASIRTSQMIRMLSQIFEVDLVYTCNPYKTFADLTELRCFCRQISEFLEPKWKCVLRALLGFFKSRPLQCSYFYSPRMMSYIQEHLSLYDYVFCNNIRTVPYVDGSKCNKIIDYVDAISMNYIGASLKANWIWRLVYKFEANRLISYENKVLKSFDKFIIISDVDRQFILRHADLEISNKHIEVIGNSVDFDDQLIIPNDSRNIVFVVGFDDIEYFVATRPEMRIGDDATWDKAEKDLMIALDRAGVKYKVLPGEGAFYGPKVEYHLRDCLGRSWQCGTVQVDFQMPGRLGAEYVDADDQRKVPVMLHRAILGSLERWIGMLLENYAGALPPWLAPTQVAVASITDSQADYAHEVYQKLFNAGYRVEEDLRSEKINYKIRELSLTKVPYILVVGEKEKQAGTVAVRERGGRNIGAMSFDDFAALLAAQVADHTNIEVNK